MNEGFTGWKHVATSVKEGLFLLVAMVATVATVAGARGWWPLVAEA